MNPSSEENLSEPHSAERRREAGGKHPIARGLCQAYGSHICQLKLS